MKKVKNDVNPECEVGIMMTSETFEEITAVPEESVEVKENEAKDEVRFKLAPKGCVVSVLEEHRYYGKSNESIAEMIFDLLDKNGYTITEKWSEEKSCTED